jgi:acyl-CoA synthetase (AMP-forming)/AMP-acid ligase II
MAFAMLDEKDVADRFVFRDLAKCGDRVAARFRIGKSEHHSELTFRDLHRVVAARAASLEDAGCRSGERVALLMPHAEPLVTTFFSALYAGLVPSIVAWPTSRMDPDKYRRNVDAVVANLKADWLVTEAAAAQQLGSHLGQTKVIESTKVSDDHAHGGTERPSPSGSGPLFIQFSGGTTGTQKSVPISANLLTSQLNSYCSTLGLSATDHVISWLPLYHDMGLVACLLLAFVNRIPLTLFSPVEWIVNPTPFLEEAGRGRATLCWLPNFAFSVMATRVRTEPGKLDLTSMRALICTSEPIRAESLDAFATRFRGDGLRASAMHTSYGMAEATFAIAQSTDEDPPRRIPVSVSALGQLRIEREDSSARFLVSVGRPIPGIDAKVVDSAGSELPDGRIGEIWVRGSCVMDDYLDGDKSGAPRSSFTDDWFRTGDLGAKIEGHLYVTGRKKDIIIVGGVNIYPEDLEVAVGRMDGIYAGRVVAMGLDDAELGTERLVVVAERSPEVDETKVPNLEAEARTTVLATCGVAPYQMLVVPPRWIVKSTAGKISRTETKARVLASWDALIARTPDTAGSESQ